MYLADSEGFALSVVGTRSPGEGLTLGREPLWPLVRGWMGGACWRLLQWSSQKERPAREEQGKGAS